MTFTERLGRAWRTSGSMLCVGLDPDPARMPAGVGSTADAVYRFCTEIVDATADLVCAFKPQFAHFAAQRAEPQLERLCSYIRASYPDVPVILDAKRGDIGSTAEHYATEAFVRYGADAVTVNPYLGTDAVTPFLAHEGRAAIVLCRTSNRGGADFQSLVVDGEPLYVHVARKVATDWARSGECALVVGATYPEELRRVREIVGELPILVPGIGAQGGDVAAAVAAGRSATGFGMILNSSRDVIYASAGADFAEAARRAAIATRDAVAHVAAATAAELGAIRSGT